MNSRALTVLGRAVTPVAMLVACALVFQATSAAFTATTTNPGNTFSAGQVGLGDDDGNTAMFTVVNAKPADTGSTCIVVTSPASQNYTTAVKIYASSVVAATNSLDTYVNIKIEEGTGGNFFSCAGFSASATDFNNTLSTFTSTYTNYGNGLATSFSPTGGTSQSRTFRFTWTFSAAAPASAQGGIAGTGFTWEAR